MTSEDRIELDEREAQALGSARLRREYPGLMDAIDEADEAERAAQPDGLRAVDAGGLTMIPCCPFEAHDALRADANLFFEKTAPIPWAPHAVGGLIFRNCLECNSTLTLPECHLCGAACSTEDRLPWKARRNPDAVAHFACVARRVLEDKPGHKFVIVVGQKTAREFSQEGSR
jgi:hypothetical protein